MANPALKNGYISVANELVEKLASVSIPSSEMRLIWVVWRKTWGWTEGTRKKDWDWISLSQFERITGMKHSNVASCLKSLVVKRILLKRKRGYKFNQNYEEWGVVKRIPPVVKRIRGGSQTTTKSSSQTHTNKRNKETNTKETGVAIATGPKGPNPYIDEVISYLKTRLQVQSLDGSMASNRKYAWLCLNKFNKDIGLSCEVVKKLIDAGLADQFHAKNMTSMSYLYNNGIKIYQSVQKGKYSPTMV